jgi:hypothetical protein
MRHLLRRRLFTFLCCGLLALACANVVLAQYGTAPNNYYSQGYHGATFPARSSKLTMMQSL